VKAKPSCGIPSTRPGQRRRDTTSWYEHRDPEFLSEAKRATDAIVKRLHDQMKSRSLFPDSSQADLKSASAGKSSLKLVVLK
jgi:hypothetical protein